MNMNDKGNKKVNVIVNAIIDDLLNLRRYHDQLEQIVDGNHRAMRNGDLDTMESYLAREEFLINKIKSLEKELRNKTDEFSKITGMSDIKNMTDLANNVEEPNRSKILALTGAIKSSAARISHINHINDEVTRHILYCFSDIQRRISASYYDAEIYDTTGKKQTAVQKGILDAVG